MQIDLAMARVGAKNRRRFRVFRRPIHSRQFMVIGEAGGIKENGDEVLGIVITEFQALSSPESPAYPDALPCRHVSPLVGTPADRRRFPGLGLGIPAENAR